MFDSQLPTVLTQAVINDVPMDLTDLAPHSSKSSKAATAKVLFSSFFSCQVSLRKQQTWHLNTFDDEFLENLISKSAMENFSIIRGILG